MEGTHLVLTIILATLIVPFETIAIALLLMASKLPWIGLEGLTFGWLNSYRVQLTPAWGEIMAYLSVITVPVLAFYLSLHPPVFVGGFGQLEVPQVFPIGPHWYCLFCTSSRHWSDAYRHANPQSPVTGTHYLIADHPRGPWRIAPGPFLDGAEPCRRYAARIVETDDGLRILGFADGGKANFGGYVMDPEPVTVGPDGLLHVSPQAQTAE